MPPANTTRSYVQPCWLGIQLHCCTACGVRYLLGNLTAARGAVAGADRTEPQPAVSARDMPPANTSCSHTQPCWLGIQLHCCAACGARCWSEIRLRRVEHTGLGTGSAQFTTMICCRSRSKRAPTSRERWEHAPGKHVSLPRAAMLVGNPTALQCSAWGTLLVGNPTAARGAHGARHGLSTVYEHDRSDLNLVNS